LLDISACAKDFFCYRKEHEVVAVAAPSIKRRNGTAFDDAVSGQLVRLEFEERLERRRIGELVDLNK